MSLFLSSGWLAAADEPVDFNREVRPLLARHCVACHGGVKHAGGVSFLFRKDLLGVGESGRKVVVPGQPDASELIRRITSNDPKVRMPPPEEHPQPLSEAEKEVLVRWVRQGAQWQEHWAYVPPVAPARPAVRDARWPRRELDYHVLAALEARGMAPAPAAAPREWLRRVSLDLTGLPPTLDEWESFRAAVAQDEEQAMAAVVDRLLATPAFGERWASLWLDLARYSDTLGFEKDPNRTIWPWRDWVVRALNAGMPLDEFTIKQLAGDIAPRDGGDVLASAFHRNTQTNDEGGTDDEQFRLEAVKDRVATTWTTWMGTTFGCAQCHAHPYDPITQREYYQFMALFDQSEDLDLTSDFPRAKVANDAARQAEVEKLEGEVVRVRGEINREGLAVANKLTGWVVFVPQSAKSSGRQGRLDVAPDGMVRKSGTHPNKVTFTLRGAAADLGVLRLDTFPEQDKPEEWGGFGGVVSKLEVEVVAADGTRRPVAFREVVADFLAGPFDPNDSLRDGVEGFGEYPMTRQPRSAFFVPNEPVRVAPGEQMEVRIVQEANCNADFIACHLARFRISTCADASLAQVAASHERQARWAQLDALRKRLEAIPGISVPVMREREPAARRATRVFVRGNPLTRGELVEPGIPAVFGGGAAKVVDRLALAKWLVGMENPLAARVMGNRFWAELFGNGIVVTQEDFGSAGTPPSNQPLLDLLALRLRDTHHWQLKPFLREVVLSSTYRQSAKASEAALARDPSNQWLGRGPRQRLTAEMVRDQALLVSGMLDRRVGGPPVFPVQPDGIWKSVYNGASWRNSSGPDRYRRALYTFRKRTSGYPALLVFDAPTGDICTPRRVATNTPLQALNTLNDAAQIEFAQGLARRMAEAGAQPDAQLAHGYRLIMLEAPAPPTMETLRGLYQDALDETRKQGGAGSAGEALASTPEQAALVLVANTLLNMDAALNR